MSLESSAKIDSRFAQRFPKRRAWVRPATQAERTSIFEGHEVPDWLTPSMAIARVGRDFARIPFVSTSPDIADATEAAAAMIIARAAEAFKAGNIATIIATRSGR
ncbi:hypothetical protein ESD82_13570 [Paracoccus pantotrophus]|uniref:Uncharacterized protein n=1 Tax=Paracoccus pantotrophus TaxID=82367 RepID=A0AAE6NYB6_PARPN|nr:hypothetical protein [Paracoccus pantotrophus]QFG37203.1 hypothetical protein ESD82_13570 [Paracoccus pantotrophus]